MDPLEILESTGRRRDWVAGQMGISESYLSLLLNGKRRWNEDVRRRFALATGVPVALIVFGAVDCDSESAEICEDVTVTIPAEALDSAPERGDGPSEYSDTCTPAKAPQSAELAAVGLPATEAAR